MVDAALAKARDGNLISRTLRRLTGGRVHADDRAARRPSPKAAAVRLVDRVRRAVDRDRPRTRPSRSRPRAPARPRATTAWRCAPTSCHQAIDRAVVDPAADHTIVARTSHVAPKVDTDDIAKKFATLLIVDRADFQLKLFKDLKLVRSYPIAVGMVGLETPAGLYHIQNKAVDPAWTKPNSDWVPKDERGKVVPGGTPQNPLKARWLGIFDGAGIHGIDPSEYGTIGHAASHGCVRMRIPDVEELYARSPSGRRSTSPESRDLVGGRPPPSRARAGRHGGRSVEEPACR